MPPLVLGAVALGGAAVAAGGLAAAFAAGGLIGFAANFGASMLLSGAAQALMPTPSMPSGTLQPRTVSVREPVMARDMVYGRVRKGGVIVFIHETGDDDAFLHLVIVLAAHRVKSIGAIYFDGEMAIDATGQAVGRWEGQVTVDKRLGDTGQSAFPGLVEEVSEHWTTAHRLEGCAALYLRLKHDRDAFPGGIPDIAADMEGKDDILDPRTGDRGYSVNTALCLADYMGHATFGLGAKIGAEDGIETERLIEAANICDEPVTLALREGQTEPATEPRYTCNGVVTLDQTPQTIIEAMLTAMAGRCVWQGAAWRIHAGAYRAPEVTLGVEDLREGGLALTTRQSRATIFNGVRGQFISPDNDWQPDDFPAYGSAAYVAEDGGEEIWHDINLPFTISASAAQRIAKIELERARRQQLVKWSGTLSAWKAAAGDTVVVEYARWGFEDKPFEVQSSRLDLSAVGEGVMLVPELILRETSPLVYDWEASEEQIYQAAPRTNLPSAFRTATPGVPELSEALYVTRDGGGLKVLITATWAPAPSAFVETYQIEARRNGGAWVEYGRQLGTRLEIRDATPGMWEVRVQAVSALGVRSNWRARTAEITGLTDPPVALEGVTLQTAGGLAILKWTRAADPDVRVAGNIVIRHSTDAAPSWANSYSMDRVAGSEAIAVVPLKPGTYLLRAEDSGGRLGPVTMLSTKGAQALAFAPVQSLQADGTFPGNKTGLAVVDGTLRLAAAEDANGVPSVVQAEGLFEFGAGMDFGAMRRVRLRSEIRLGVLALADRIDARLEPIDTWASFDGTEGAETDVVVEIRETDDDPASAPVWSEWGRIDNHEIEARAIEARAWLRTADATYTPVVSRLRLHADEVA
ncbi:phage tail protein [Salibaculum griseiflavum]|uniref:Host specificity protein J n=1 Tax=Salibaculum griseiflavum TaxID=1914409 RepID=A0A2V1P0Q6_9RHOB|nr:phage tail protein [Salibaculum griseiflavum]PWG16141.1 host specificity protein J [Salibaculum griseiflavum]